MIDKLTVSVIIPVYNGERFLDEALQSVLAQTLPPDEVVVVDDGSNDRTAQIVAEAAAQAAVPLQYVYQTNQGPAAARNHGLRLARGELMAFQDADAIWSMEKLAIQVALLERHPQAHAVIGYSQIALTDPNDVAATVLYGRPGPILLLQEGLFRRSIFDLAGQFDPHLCGDEDVEWLLRLLEHPVELVIHPDVVLTYRRHTENVTGSLAGSRRQFLFALQRAVARRRKTPPGNARTATVTFLSASPSDRERGG